LIVPGLLFHITFLRSIWIKHARSADIPQTFNSIQRAGDKSEVFTCNKGEFFYNGGNRLSKIKTKPLKPDPVLKDFWSDNHRFADLFNQVLFQGQEIIDPEHLAEQDTEESTVFWEKEQLDAILKSRDVIKQHVQGARLVLIGLENQMNFYPEWRKQTGFNRLSAW